jgi:hypothetical protein
MDKSKYGVHEAHCCIKHGCKYGDKDCTVVNGQTAQLYTCEWCEEDGIKTLDQLATDIHIIDITNKLFSIIEKHEEILKEPKYKEYKGMTLDFVLRHSIQKE